MEFGSVAVMAQGAGLHGGCGRAVSRVLCMLLGEALWRELFTSWDLVRAAQIEEQSAREYYILAKWQTLLTRVIYRSIEKALSEVNERHRVNEEEYFDALERHGE